MRRRPTILASSLAALLLAMPSLGLAQSDSGGATTSPLIDYQITIRTGPFFGTRIVTLDEYHDLLATGQTVRVVSAAPVPDLASRDPAISMTGWSVGVFR